MNIHEVDKRTQEIIQEMLDDGRLSTKLCFQYCGEDKCDCAGGIYWKIYLKQHELWQQEQEIANK